MAEQQEENTSLFIIESKTNNQQFTVDRKIIESSALLKNICDITEITNPIVIDCPSESMKIFINLINHYQTTDIDFHDSEYEKDLYDSVTCKKKENLIKLIQDLCILDSDFFLDSVADYILGIIGNEEGIGSCWMQIQQYLGLESDFTKRSRNLMENDEKLEYFFTIRTDTFKFPFPNKSLYSLKTDFSTPMNVLIARIIQRSDEKVSYLLSLINKTIKNEVDRYPLKVTEFSARTQTWKLRLYYKKLKKGFTFFLNCEHLNNSYFDLRKINFNENYIKIIKKRKIIAKNASIYYNVLNVGEPFIDGNSLDYVISKSAEICFSKGHKTMYCFDLTKCQSPSIFYTTSSDFEWEIKFEEFYKHLIAKDLSKEIRIHLSNDIYKFFSPSVGLHLFKKANASKFESLKLITHHKTIFSNFKNFVTNYMEDDGDIISTEKFHGIPSDEIDHKFYEPYKYKVSDVKKYFDCFFSPSVEKYGTGLLYK